MNHRIKAYIDGLFAGVTLEGEAAALHDELGTNCSERFDDLVREGYSEEEAFEFVRECMGDVDELIAPYRKGGQRQEPRMEAQVAPYFEQGYDVTGVTRLEVVTRDASVLIQPNSGDELVVLYEEDGRGEFVPPTVTREGETLRVETPRREHLSFSFDLESTIQSIVNVFSGRGMRSAHLALYVPRGMMPGLNVQGGSGSLRVEEVALRSADVHLNSGGIRVETDTRVRGGVYTLHTASGSIRVKAAADEIHLRSMSGSVKAECDARVLDAQAVSGGVRVEGAVREVQAKSVSGSVHIALRNTDAADITGHTVSGSVHVGLPENIPGFTLEASSVSGRVHNAFGDACWGEGGAHISASSTSGSVHIDKL